MKTQLKVAVREPLLRLADTIVYAQKPYWCNGPTKQLALSFMAPRQYYPFDSTDTRPLIIFLCGGAFTRMDRNVWMGELAWFAKKGYAIASVDYSTHPYTAWPDQITEIKQAIRFLRTHAEEFRIQPNKIVIMGESAGAYLAILAALTNGDTQYDAGDFLEQSSSVNAAVSWYCVSKLSGIEPPPGAGKPNLAGFPDLHTLVSRSSPPLLLLHGTSDEIVGSEHSELLYDALVSCGVQTDLYLLEGANHADKPFVQSEIKEIILSFIDTVLK